jgi:restriction endonuclease S subunit
LRDYLFYFLKNNQARIRGGDGAVFPSISREQIANIEIPLPSFEEQQEIVLEIRRYQKVIDGARQVLSGYRPRFDCDPGWPMTALSEVCSFSSGGTPPKSNPEYWIGHIPWVSPKDMKVPRLRDAQLHVSDSAIDETATEIAPAGSVLVLVRGMGLANGVAICELLVPCAFNQDIKALHPNPGIMPGYLAAALRQQEMQLKNAIRTAAHGTLKIETDSLRKITVPLPPIAEQEKILAELETEASQMAAVHALIPKFESRIQRVLARPLGKNGAE